VPTWRPALSIQLRFRFLATTLAAQDSAVAEAMTTVYRDGTHTWKNVCDDETRRGLLGQAALALFTAFVDDGDGRTIDDVAEQVVRRGGTSRAAGSST
jgi:hypothetical protein